MGKEEEAERVVESLRGRVDAVLAFVASQPPLARPAVGWMEWTEPIFVS
jgi:ABC-type Fe3+-hydroxamate transport system substrate-binding protein